MQIELDYPAAEPVELNGTDCVLVIVDMCNEVCDPAGSRFQGDRVAGIVRPIARLRDRVRAAGGTIIHTQSVRAPDALEFTMGKPTHHLEGTWGVEFVKDLQPAPDEHVVVKRSHDPFNRTELEDLLARVGAKPGTTHVVVSGTATRGCVQCAVVGFSVRDYFVYVPIDCTAQREERNMLMAFDLFSGWGYRFNTTLTRSDLITIRAHPSQSPQP